VRGYVFGDSTQPVVTLADTTLEVGYGPPTWFGRFVNSRDGSTSSRRSGRRAGRSSRSRARGAITTSCRTRSRAAAVIDTGEWQLGDRYAASGYLTRPVSPGAYAFQVTTIATTWRGRRGRATVTCDFNTARSDRNPPWMTELSVLSDAATTDMVPTGARNRLRYRLSDETRVNAVSIDYRASDAAPWRALDPAAPAEGEVAIPDEPGYLSFRIEARDAAGNVLTYAIEPAVFVLGPGGAPGRVPATRASAAPVAPAPVLALEVETPARARLRVRFSLPDARPAALEVMDVAGRRLVSRRLDADGRGPHTLDLASAAASAPESTGCACTTRTTRSRARPA
jgi:hypothetical protein